MRGLKSTIALVVVLIGLVAYIYFVDSKKPASDAPETKAKAFTVDADQIEEIQIKPASGEASRVQKTNGTWQLVEPEKTEADQGQVSNAATSLADARDQPRRRREPVGPRAVRVESSRSRRRVPRQGTEGRAASAARREDCDRR